MKFPETDPGAVLGFVPGMFPGHVLGKCPGEFPANFPGVDTEKTSKNIGKNMR